MRRAVIDALCELACGDDRVVLLTADIGYNLVERFAATHPDRFVNVGVSEQSMVGIATGLAEAGFVPYCYSIAPFAALRPLEFIRNGPVAHQLPVRLVGVGGGFEYGPAGATHHGLEDVGCLRVLQGLSVVAPADAAQAAAAVCALHDTPGPVYFRIGKDEQRRVPGLDGAFEVARVQQLTVGEDVLLLGMGGICTEVADAAQALAALGAHVSAAVVASLSPAPVADLERLVESHRLVVTVEAHSATGGLGSLVAEVMAECGSGSRLVRVAVRGTSEMGDEAYLNRVHGLDSASLVGRVLSELPQARAGGQARSRKPSAAIDRVSPSALA